MKDLSEVIEEYFGADIELFCEAYGLFKSQHFAMLSDLERALNQRHLPQIEFSAHKLKGALDGLGVQSLSHILAEIENSARKGNLEPSGVDLEYLKNEIDIQMDRINNYLKVCLVSKRVS